MPRMSDNNQHAMVRRSLEDNMPVRAARVSLSRIRLHPTHYRNLGDLRELAENIRIEGLHQPITVQQRGDHYEVVDGRRRFGAAQLAGLRTVPVFIQAARSDAEVVSAMVATDVHKRLMTTAEKAHAVRLMRQQGFTVKEIAQRWGVAEPTVYGWLAGNNERKTTPPRRMKTPAARRRAPQMVSVKKLTDVITRWDRDGTPPDLLAELRTLVGLSEEARHGD